MGHWTDFRAFRLFYKQIASCLYRPDVHLRVVGSFRRTFSSDSGPPDVQVCILILRERSEEFGLNFFGG